MNQFDLFIIISFSASLLMIALAVYTSQYRQTRGANAFIWMLSSISIWMFAIGAGLLANTELISYRWAVIRMIGVVTAPVVWLLFALQFSDNAQWIKPWKVIGLSIIPTITILLMMTNDSHHLFLKDIIFEYTYGYLNDKTWVLGPWFWIHVTYSYALILIADFFLFRTAYRLAASYRKQTVALTIGTLIPLLFNLSFTFHFFPNIQVNYDPLGFVLTGIIFTFGLFQLKLFDLRPIAHQLIIDSMEDAVFVIDRKHRIVEINPYAEKMIGKDKDEVIAKPIEILFKDILLNPRQSNKFEYSQIGFHGRTFEAQLSPISKNNRVFGYLILMRDITERKALENQLTQLATFDSLTGLKNRQAFLGEAEAIIKKSKDNGTETILAFMDLDKFKKINDSYGHNIGDQVLENIANIMEKEVRVTDLVGRFGGDEFLFIFQNTSLDKAKSIINRMIERIHQIKLPNEDEIIQLSASVGYVSVNDETTASIEELIQIADQRMYTQKESK